ncbi:MAG: D-glycero-beta-D-manno-heptose 1-phosphate adenylyltransferase [Candidatus Omnitrophota bacterium]
MRCDKIKTLSGLIRILKKYKAKKKRVVFTNGCFDILHRGHVDYLARAKAMGDLLVVGLNSDSSVRKLKGRNRPIVKEKDRARVLSALGCVDFVVIFNSPTPFGLIKGLRPDVLVKGGDWKREDIVGSKLVRSYGGRVKSLSYLKGFSTKGLIKKIASC